MIKIYPYTKRASAAAVWCALLFLSLFFIKNAELCTSLVSTGLEICIRNVIPSLFPYMVISTLIMSSGLAKYLGRLLTRPLSLLFALNGGCAAAIILGITAGFPMGAKTAVDTYKRGMCSREEAERVCCFCNNTGPAFIIGGIGVGFFGDAAIGVRLYIIELISVLILGILLSFGKERKKALPREIISCEPDLTGAVKGAVSSVLAVCGFVVFFALINGALEAILSSFHLTEALPFIFSISEVTGGAKAASDIGSLPLAAFSVGWSGICVHAQSAGFMISEGLKMKKYIMAKALQGLICALICVFWQNV